MMISRSAFLTVPIIAYGGVMTMLWGAQDSLIFPFRHETVPVAAVEGWRRETVEVNGFGTQAFLVGEHDETAEGQPVLLFLHGNGVSANISAQHAAGELAARGFRVVVAEYPGYSGNPGAPSEAALLRTGEALATYVRRNWPDRPLAVVGESIGSAPAIHLAATGRADLLVVDSGFTSLTETTRNHFPWVVGIKNLLSHPMDNMAAIRSAGGRMPPSLFLTSSHDMVVPVHMGGELSALVPGSLLVRSPLLTHGVLWQDPRMSDVTATWLRERTAPTATPASQPSPT